MIKWDLEGKGSHSMYPKGNKPRQKRSFAPLTVTCSQVTQPWSRNTAGISVTYYIQVTQPESVKRNLPSALLAVWPGSFTCYGSNTGWIDTKWESAPKVNSAEENSPAAPARTRTCNLLITIPRLWQPAIPAQIPTIYLQGTLYMWILCFSLQLTIFVQLKRVGLTSYIFFTAFCLHICSSCLCSWILVGLTVNHWHGLSHYI